MFKSKVKAFMLLHLVLFFRHYCLLQALTNPCSQQTIHSFLLQLAKYKNPISVSIQSTILKTSSPWHTNCVTEDNMMTVQLELSEYLHELFLDVAKDQIPW